MNALVIYDSAYGNTAQIARAIGDALGSPAEVATLQAGEVTPDHLTGLSLLIVGSPTQRFSSTPATKNFLDRIPEHALKGVRVAAFDTRFTREHMKSVSSVLSFSAGLVGDSAYAAKSIAAGLKKKAASWSLRPKDSTLKTRRGPCCKASWSAPPTGPGVSTQPCMLDFHPGISIKPCSVLAILEPGTPAS